MRIALISDTFPPLNNSGAVQLRDLSREFVRQEHALTVITSSPDQKESWLLENLGGVKVLRLKVPRTKDVSNIRRALSELVMPFIMMIQLKRVQW